jgi:Domain of unknown function (DUF4158)
MKRQWTNEELIADFTISAKELDLIGDSKTDHNLLGAACLLKYFQYEGRFPDQKQHIPPIVIVHLAKPLGVVPEKIIPYDWEGRTIKAHRAAIRTFLDGNFATLADVELLLDMAQHLTTKAERRVEKAFVKDIKKVSGKTTLLFRLAEAAVDKPDGTVREVVFPVVSEQTLRDLVKEYKAGGSTYQQQVQKAMRGPYSKHYRW